PEVSSALRSKQPVVALESTIISHGMPYPRNVETALQVEAIVRKNGAIPATIAVINGRMKVGLSKQEITNLGKLGTAVLKVSRRDLPVVIAQGQNGATTVAATMIIADLAGISIFATGGIGGVHRGASESMDVSADLQELARTNVAVVCAGAKSILDLGLTLEYLETQGVPVLGYQTTEFPAFYTRNSGFKVDQSIDSAEELADILSIKWQLGLKGGAVIANPIPQEFQLEYAVMEQAIQQALAKAEKKNIKGKEITPFLLASIEQITGGKSLDANVELVFNNAKLAAQIAEYLRVS
ncbi:MAG TPA: pseudouridine-5'-phosphate glycosidase, partial [Haliscomenobacter sp.]|uniref:pseudouridine-5'-phosphate glycosidase n=1 Tax=Haliscomenobacter sp. TaxID=2717303 RepID=UPI002BEA6021